MMNRFGKRLRAMAAASLVTGITLGLVTAGLELRGEEQKPAAEKPAAEKPVAKKPPGKEIKMFDGKTLKGWGIVKKWDFERHGEVKVKDGEIVLSKGGSMTGIVWKGEKLPTGNYEVTLKARRLDDDSDFFCGLTFPVKDAHLSLILGGWGGSLTGISSLDGFDASENESTGWMEFKNGQWYAVRVRVTDKKVEAWIGKEQIVDVTITDRKLGVRWEMEPCQPFGIATYETKGGVKDIVLKRLQAPAKE